MLHYRGFWMTEKIGLTLRKNGIHSFRQGLVYFNKYKESKEILDLRDSILFLHNGIELLLKEILHCQNELLIFEKLEKAGQKKLLALKKEINIFELAETPYTARYLTVIKRINDMEKEGLNEKLLGHLESLNRYRNQIQHYAIKFTPAKISDLLEELIPLFSEYVILKIPEIKKEILDIKKQSIKTLESNLEINAMLNFINLMPDYLNLLKDKKIPSNLMNSQNEVLLPNFTEILKEYKIPDTNYRIDMFCIAENSSWIIEVKGVKLVYDSSIIAQLNYYKKLSNASNIWLIVLGEIKPRIRQEAMNNNIYLSDINGWRMILDLL